MPSAPGPAALSDVVCHLRANEALNRMESRAGRSPLVFAIPRESLAERFGDAPTMRVPEPGQDRSRGRQAEHVDELLPEQPQCDRIQQKHTFAGEGDQPALREKVKQLVNIEVRSTHDASGKTLKLRVDTITMIASAMTSKPFGHVSR